MTKSVTVACNTVRTAPLRFQQQTLGAATLKLRRLSQLHHQRSIGSKTSSVSRCDCHESVPCWWSARRRLSGVARSVTDIDMAANGALTHWVKILPIKIRPPQENHPAHSQPHPLRLTFRDATTNWDTEPRDKQMTFFPRTIPDYSETAIPKKPTTATTPHSEHRFPALTFLH